MDEIEQNTQEQLEEMKRAMLEVGELYHITFDTPAGQKVLEHLTKMTCGSSLTGNDMMDANASVSAAEFMCIREGHNQVIRFINKLITFYKDQK